MNDVEPIRVLLVDDDPDFLEVTARALARRGFDVSTAQDGAEALARVEATKLDALVLDVRMPGIEGTEVFRLVRHMVPDLPVIMLTGHGTVKQAFEISREGVFEYLTKPCDAEKLTKVLHRAVADRRLRSLGGEVVRVLLVDDDADFAETLSMSLQRRGFDVLACTNGPDALATLQEQAFDVAVVDLVMPDMDGLEVLKRMKRTQPDVEVLMLTGHPSVRQAIEGLADGAFDFLVKPPSIDALVSQLHRAAAARERARPSP